MVDFQQYKTQLLREKDLFLFDMDGTVLQSEPLHMQSIKAVLAPTKANQVSEHELMNRFVGMPDLIVFQTLLPELATAEHLALEREKNLSLLEIIGNLNQVQRERYFTTGILSFLTELKDKKKRVVLVSASSQLIVNTVVDCFFKDLFDDYQGREASFSDKPSPAPYLKIMRQMKVSSARTVIFEDSPTGLLAAKRTGSKVFQVLPPGDRSEPIFNGFLPIAHF